MLFKLLPSLEASRCAAIVVPLPSVAAIWLHTDGASGLGVLTLWLSAPPSFQSRRMRVSDDTACEWRPRGDFTPHAAASRSQLHSFVMSSADAGAFIGCLQAYGPGRGGPIYALSRRGAAPGAQPPPPHGSAVFDDAAVAVAAAAAARARGEPPPFAPACRASILDALVRARLLTRAAAGGVEAADVDARDRTRCRQNNRLGALAGGCFTPCFFDYLNFTATNGADVDAALGAPLATDASYWIEDYCPPRPGGRSLDGATVGDALR